MTDDNDEPQYRAYHRPDPDRVELREDTDDGDGDSDEGVFRVRMPIATTGDVRNEGDEPLTRDEIGGMATQIDDRAIGVFGDHGRNPDLAGSRYSAFEKLGEWQDPDVEQRSADDEFELVATARMMDPDTMPDATGAVREGLARLKAQVERGMSLSSSIGWRDDESFPGGVDLMETSIVGIGADPRTTSQGAAFAHARAVVMGADPDNERHLSAQQAEITEQLLNAYREEQGNGSVGNFEDWLWNVAYYAFDENQFHAGMTALQEFYRDTTPLEEPVTAQFVPFLDGEQSSDSSNEHDMTDDTDESGDGDGADRDGTQDGSDGMDEAEYREFMREQQEQQTEILRALADALREDGEDEDDDDDDEEENEGDDEDEDEEDDENENSVTVDGEEYSAEDVAELRTQLSDARQNGDIEGADEDGERSAEGNSDEDTATASTRGNNKWGL